MAKTNALIIEPNQIVEFSGEKYKITHLLDIDQVLAKHCRTGKTEILFVQDLQPVISPNEPNQPSKNNQTELSLISDEDWAEARQRYEIIFPLLNANYRRTAEVRTQAQKYGIHLATLYRWLKLYEETCEVSSLLPNKGGHPHGLSKITPEVEVIIKSAIDDVYLKKRRRSFTATKKEIERLCHAAGDLPVPNDKTIRRRINRVSARERTAKRYSPKRAREEFDLIQGEFPHAAYPLSVIQIDHTKLDIIIVDETDRLSIGRPWITVAIDVFSRMVVGFAILLDSPANISIGLCLPQAILPKETWLAKIGVEGSWAVWGFPKTIHADNAREFRGNMLRRACEEYGITLEWRPIGRPHYGGHVERLMGTFGNEIHDLPGTTFSNPQERKEYDSEKEAVMTLRELEKWLTTFILGEYHVRFHEGINTTPLAKWREGILGSDTVPGTGLPPRVIETEKLRLDFLPAMTGTIQQYGVRFDNIHYNHDILKRYVHAKDEKDPRLKKQFIFKRDPRDISEIYFYDPEIKQYFAVPYRDTSRPAISLWEMREIKKNLKDQGRKKVNETMIFETREKLREQEEQATKLTKAARRKRERRLLYQSAKSPETPDRKAKNPAIPIGEQIETANSTSGKRKILPFEELEELE